MGFWDFDFWGKEVILSCANELTQWNRVMDFRRFHCSCKSADWWNSTVFSMSITRCGMTYAGWPCALSLASLHWSIAAWQVVQPMLESYVCQLYCVRSPHSVLHCTGHLVVSLFHTSTMWHDDFSIGGVPSFWNRWSCNLSFFLSVVLVVMHFPVRRASLKHLKNLQNLQALSTAPSILFYLPVEHSFVMALVCLIWDGLLAVVYVCIPVWRYL